MDIDALRALFPITQEKAYLNHAAVSPWSQPVYTAMQAHLDQFWQEGTFATDDGVEVSTQARTRAARLIGAQPGEVALTYNTSHGITLVASGLQWRPGDNVVCAEGEFPATVYPWRSLENRGVTVRIVPLQDGRVPLDGLRAAIDRRTRVVSLSFVEFYTGYRNDLAPIAEMCHAAGAFFCVDAIQGLGALALDVEATGVDFLCAGGFKWLMGPTGTGIFYCRRERLNDLSQVVLGFDSTVPTGTAYFDFNLPWKADATRFEIGSSSPSNLAGFSASLKLLLDLGATQIEERILGLTDYLLDRLDQRQVTVITPHASRAERSGIVTFIPPGKDPVALAKRMREAGIIISPRGAGIRVSPHFYNTTAEIDRVLEMAL
jgi:selenocysteine lyase/cysteine desulfurase